MTTILLIDDSRLVRALIENELTRSGYRVITAADGESGLRTAQLQHPDLILLDMLLPKLSGLDVLRALKADKRTGRHCAERAFQRQCCETQGQRSRGFL